MDRSTVDEQIKGVTFSKGPSWLPYVLLGVFLLAAILGLRLDHEALWPRYLLLVVIAILGYLRISRLKSLWQDWVNHGRLLRQSRASARKDAKPDSSEPAGSKGRSGEQR